MSPRPSHPARNHRGRPTTAGRVPDPRKKLQPLPSGLTVASRGGGRQMLVLALSELLCRLRRAPLLLSRSFENLSRGLANGRVEESEVAETHPLSREPVWAQRPSTPKCNRTPPHPAGLPDHHLPGCPEDMLGAPAAAVRIASLSKHFVQRSGAATASSRLGALIRGPRRGGDAQCAPPLRMSRALLAPEGLRRLSLWLVSNPAPHPCAPPPPPQ